MIDLNTPLVTYFSTTIYMRYTIRNKLIFQFQFCNTNIKCYLLKFILFDIYSLLLIIIFCSDNLNLVYFWNWFVWWLKIARQ